MAKEPTREELLSQMRLGISKENIQVASPVTEAPASLVSDSPMEEPKKKEVKRRTTVNITPSVFRNAKRVAYMQRESLSRIVDDFLTDYVNSHLDDLKEFDKLDEKKKKLVDDFHGPRYY